MTERQTQLAREFQSLSSWEDRYKRLIERGKKLAPLPVEMQDEKFKIRGCQSQVWLHAKLNPDQTVHFDGDSDALIVKGLVALVIEMFSDATPSEILQADPNFLKQLGFEGHLSPSRANGVFAMIRQVLYYAQAFQALARMSQTKG